MSSEVAIRLRNLSKVFRIYERPEDRLIQMATLGRIRRFTEFSALADVSLDIRRGETVGIIGRNGCGKSTLLQIACGILQPTTGTVEVNGRVAALLELGAGFNGEFTGRENVYMNGAILGFSRDEMDARFEQIAAFAAIGDFIERPVKTYSSGMFVRLAFAVATAVEPEILVVDEALAVGDEAFQRKCFARIEAIKERGGTVLFVSHAAPMIVQLCDRAVLLDGGEKILEGRPKRVTAQYQRLVNASAEAAPEIRASIVEMGEGAVASSDTMPDVDGEPVEGASEAPQREAAAAVVAQVGEVEARSYFDPNLISQSATILEERGARIRDMRILEIGGEQVNILQTGRRYVLEYLVDFSVAASGVGFGMWVRTKEGFGLGGAQTIFSRSLVTKSVQAGTCAKVQFEFSCIFLADTYFLSCGLFGTPEEEQIVMHRMIDVLMFRVEPEADLLSTGRIDINPQVQIELSGANHDRTGP